MAEEKERMSVALEWMDQRKEGPRERKKLTHGKQVQKLGRADISARLLETPPRLRIPFDGRVEKVTLHIEDLNFDMPELEFMERFCQHREARLEYGHNGSSASCSSTYTRSEEMRG